MRVDLFDFELPPERIALRPARPRDSARLLDRAGRMPLPPYIASKREADDADRSDYQTIFAQDEGAVAAPTAALHFTARLLQALHAREIGRETLTLHVGAGTFLPVKSE